MKIIHFKFDAVRARQLVLVAGLAFFTSVFAGSDSKWIEVKGGAWKPDGAMLSALEIALKPEVIAASKNRGGARDWSKYTFQYQGRAPIFGKRYIYVNAFCDGHENEEDLQNVWVEVMDGGSCYFSAKYEPETKRIFEVAINGVA